MYHCVANTLLNWCKMAERINVHISGNRGKARTNLKITWPSCAASTHRCPNQSSKALQFYTQNNIQHF